MPTPSEPSPIITPFCTWRERGSDTGRPIIWSGRVDQPMVGDFGANFRESRAGTRLPNTPPLDNGAARRPAGQ